MTPPAGGLELDEPQVTVMVVRHHRQEFWDKAEASLREQTNLPGGLRVLTRDNFRNEHNPAALVNEMLKEVTTPYVYWAADDDWWDPRYFAVLWKMLEDMGPDVVSATSWCWLVEEGKGPHLLPAPIPSVGLWRTEALRAIGLREEAGAYCEGWLLVDALARGWKRLIVKFPLYYYRQHDGALHRNDDAFPATVAQRALDARMVSSLLNKHGQDAIHRWRLACEQGLPFVVGEEAWYHTAETRWQLVELREVPGAPLAQHGIARIEGVEITVEVTVSPLGTVPEGA